MATHRPIQKIPFQTHINSTNRLPSPKVFAELFSKSDRFPQNKKSAVTIRQQQTKVQDYFLPSQQYVQT